MILICKLSQKPCILFSCIKYKFHSQYSLVMWEESSRLWIRSICVTINFIIQYIYLGVFFLFSQILSSTGLIRIEKMSTSAMQDLINSLGFTEEEKDALRIYFIRNEKRQNDVLTSLSDYTTDEAKLVFLRSLIFTPGMFSHRDSIEI